MLISLIDFDRLGGVVHWLLGNLGPIAPASLAVFAAVVAMGFWLVVRPANSAEPERGVPFQPEDPAHIGYIARDDRLDRAFKNALAKGWIT